MPRPLWILLARAAIDHIVAIGRDQLIIAPATIDEIVAAEAIDLVVAAQGVHLVVATAAVGRNGVGEDLVAVVRTSDFVVTLAAYAAITGNIQIACRIADPRQAIHPAH